MSKQQRRQQWQRVRDNLNDHHTPREVKDEQAAQARKTSEEERQSLIERKIQQAMADGAFDNLPGAGKPLDLNQNPYMEPGQEMAFGLLKRNGMAPAWVTRNKQIRHEMEQARRDLRRVWDRLVHKETTATYWQIAVAEFRAKVSKINHKVDTYNLMVPTISCQRNHYNADTEIERVKQGRILED